MFAQLALLLWPVVAVIAFTTVQRPTLAAVGVFLGGMLLLPEGAGFDAPGLPNVGKYEITSLCVLVGALVRCPNRLIAARPGRGDAVHHAESRRRVFSPKPHLARLRSGAAPLHAATQRGNRSAGYATRVSAVATPLLAGLALGWAMTSSPVF